MSSFAIVNLRDGTRKDMIPPLIPNDAFSVMENMYLFRGRIQRRSCYSRLGSGNSRLRWQIGVTGGSPFGFTLPDIPITSTIAQFSIGNVWYTDFGSGAVPADLIATNGSLGSTLNRATGVISLVHPAGAGVPVYYYPGLPAMGLRVLERVDINDELLLGFDTKYSYQYDFSNNDFSAANTFKVLAPGVTSVFLWSGDNTNFLWTYNYSGALFATNNFPGLNAYALTAGTDAIPSVITIPAGHNVAVGDIVMIANTSTSNTLNGRTFQVTVVAGANITINNTVAPGGGVYASGFVIVLNRQVNALGIGGDGVKYFDGSSGQGWVNFVVPLVAETPQRLLRGALICLPYKDRFVFLNTFESSGTGAAVNFKQRARWSQNGTIYFSEDNAATPVEYLLPINKTANFNAWFDGTPGKGGFIDAPTQESIISAEFVKDTLIVYFERSTWQLVYTGNETLPFIWQKINTELGCESTFSVVPFDSGVFAVGNYGIISTDSTGVNRIDQKIPDEVFGFQNLNNGVKRVCGIRDYTSQLVYWSYPVQSDEDNDDVSYTLTYPNQVLVYNYVEGSWAEFDDCFTCFGVWQKDTDATWGSSTIPWETAIYSWNSQAISAKFPDVIAGNQRGFVFVYSQLQQIGRNVACLEISAVTITSASQATITAPDHNLTNEQYVQIDAISGVTTGLTNFVDRIFKVTQATVSTFVIETDIVGPPPLPFSGSYVGGALLIHIPKPTLVTKEFNPFLDKSNSIDISYLDIWMDRTSLGQVTCDSYTNSNTSVALASDIVLTSPEPFSSYSANQERIFHRVYLNLFGSTFQNKISLTDIQMRDPNISSSDIRIHGLVYYVSPSGRLPYDV